MGWFYSPWTFSVESRFRRSRIRWGKSRGFNSKWWTRGSVWRWKWGNVERNRTPFTFGITGWTLYDSKSYDAEDSAFDGNSDWTHSGAYGKPKGWWNCAYNVTYWDALIGITVEHFSTQRGASWERVHGENRIYHDEIHRLCSENWQNSGKYDGNLDCDRKDEEESRWSSHRCTIMYVRILV